MLVCISESRRRVASPPPSSLGVMDFVAGTYSWNEGALTAADCIDHTAYIGADGLEIGSATNTAPVSILGEFATFLGDCQFTIVFDVEIPTGSASPTLIAVEEPVSGNIVELFWRSEFEADDKSGFVSRFADDFVNATMTGIHKVALTRTDAKLCISVNGNAIGAGSTGDRDDSTCVLPDPSNPMTDFHLGGYAGGSVPDHIKIRSVTFYDPVTDADLPGLSA